ncbi:MAG: hypothetical protein AABX11_01595 [Nanoarchaeota archaeon]
MVEQSKVIVDKCVLIGASLNHDCLCMPEKIVDPHYLTSKRLLDYLKLNAIKKEGMILKITSDTTKVKLGNIMERNLYKLNKIHNLDSKTILDEHTFAMVKSTSVLSEYINSLEVLDIKDGKIYQIRKEVSEFHRSVPIILKKNNPKTEIKRRISKARGIFRKFERRWTKEDFENDFRILKKLFKKFRGHPLDKEDTEILAYATYLKRETHKEYNIWIASTDHHFSNVIIDGGLSSIIPNKIEQRFQVKCDWPEKVLGELLRNNQVIDTNDTKNI